MNLFAHARVCVEECAPVQQRVRAIAPTIVSKVGQQLGRSPSTRVSTTVPVKHTHHHPSRRRGDGVHHSEAVLHRRIGRILIRVHTRHHAAADWGGAIQGTARESGIDLRVRQEWRGPVGATGASGSEVKALLNWEERQSAVSQLPQSAAFHPHRLESHSRLERRRQLTGQLIESRSGELRLSAHRGHASLQLLLQLGERNLNETEKKRTAQECESELLNQSELQA